MIDANDRPDLRHARPEEIEEWNTFAFEEFMKSVPDDGYLGQAGLSRVPNGEGGLELALMVGDAHLKTMDLNEFNRRRAANEPVIPIHSWRDEQGDIRYLLKTRDADAERHGVICPNCLQYQKSFIYMACEWEHGRGPVNGGCGFNRTT